MWAERNLWDTLSEYWDSAVEKAKETWNVIWNLFGSISELAKSSLETTNELLNLQNENRWIEESKPEYWKLIHPEIPGKKTDQVKWFGQTHEVIDEDWKEIVWKIGEKIVIDIQKKIYRGLKFYEPDYIVIEWLSKNSNRSTENDIVERAFSENGYLSFPRDEKGFLIIENDYDKIFSWLRNEIELQERLYLHLWWAMIYSILHDVEMVEWEPELDKYYNDIDKNLEPREDHVVETIENLIEENEESLKIAISYWSAHSFKDNFEKSTKELNIKYNDVHTGDRSSWDKFWNEYDLEEWESKYRIELNPRNKEKEISTFEKGIKNLKDIFLELWYIHISVSWKNNRELAESLREGTLGKEFFETIFKFENYSGEEIELGFSNIFLFNSVTKWDVIYEIFNKKPSLRDNYNFNQNIRENLWINIPDKFSMHNIYNLSDFSEYLKHSQYLSDKEIVNLKSNLVRFINYNFEIELDSIHLDIWEFWNSNILKIRNSDIAENYRWDKAKFEFYLNFETNTIIMRNKNTWEWKNDYGNSFVDHLNISEDYEWDDISLNPENKEISEYKIQNNILKVEKVLNKLWYNIDAQASIEKMSVFVKQTIYKNIENKDDGKKKATKLKIHFDELYWDKEINLGIPFSLLSSYTSVENIIFSIFNSSSTLREDSSFINKINDELNLDIPNYLDLNNMTWINELIPYFKNIKSLPEYEIKYIAVHLWKHLKKEFDFKIASMTWNFWQSNNPNILKIWNDYVDRNQEKYNENLDYYFDLEKDELYSQDKNGNTARIYKNNY